MLERAQNTGHRETHAGTPARTLVSLSPENNKLYYVVYVVERRRRLSALCWSAGERILRIHKCMFSFSQHARSGKSVLVRVPVQPSCVVFDMSTHIKYICNYTRAMYMAHA